jgi:hypothetical protein
MGRACSTHKGEKYISQPYRPPRHDKGIDLLFFVLYSLSVMCPLLFVNFCVLCLTVVPLPRVKTHLQFNFYSMV